MWAVPSRMVLWWFNSFYHISQTLFRLTKEYKQKMGTLKRNQQTEKKKNFQLLEEARKREDLMADDADHLSVSQLKILLHSKLFQIMC